ncbi:bifunctional phosphopantothenoylcysteine decarboxylase/phosphopantothenate--cysteine ligase CoaBC [Daejeonella oryzae]|uniref:bifunctional phosphopantothenoylcysteine decarboxylase/phosphopantothenate--cysteine ligase CoaBC n=1 Tax=Daejeonella oryzae TaxID=1122943 RepID=UPI0004217D9C|nr:bifunctional phosphopantothenoylcysteine decarboxylase/phosphopantothenate--cysteine ligase CoaBC [Daejeonella oryzae]
MLKDKKILLGVCGSIAAYKAAFLTRLLVKTGANVKIIMTPDAVNFITPLTLSTLSKNPVLISYFDPETGEWNNHVDLALWADVFLIAPASANTIAKMANGLCDNLLSAIYLSAKCPVFIAPAMDLDMWKHGSTRQNIQKLATYGNSVINPGDGELASGLTGEGRMAEPEDIINLLLSHFNQKLPLQGKKCIVTAGPTYEAIDPVRFIGNHSSGKMGFAIADELARLGANVRLITGPTSLKSNNNINRIDVVSCDDMLKEVDRYFHESDVTVMSAAVADYKPLKKSSQKIKKNDALFNLELVKTTDILAHIGQKKSAEQILVGFALETDHEVENAVTKLKRKNLDFIVLNSLQDEGAGFKGDCNKITIIDQYLNTQAFPLKPKAEVAKDICQKIIDLII